MPRVYTSQAERQQAKIIRELSGMAKGHQAELAELWGISQPAVSYRLKTGNISVMDLCKAKAIFDADEIAELIRGRS